MSGLSAILLAAGESRRMGTANKLLLPYRGVPLIRHVAGQLLASGVREVILVSGHQAEAVREALDDLPLRFVHHPDYARGMRSSIQRGAAAIDPTATGYLLCLGDMPLLRTAHHNALIEVFTAEVSRGKTPIVRPFVHDLPGHPVLFHRRFLPELLQLREGEGCRPVIRQNARHLLRRETSDPAYVVDVDTEAAYSALDRY